MNEKIIIRVDDLSLLLKPCKVLLNKSYVNNYMKNEGINMTELNTEENDNVNLINDLNNSNLSDNLILPETISNKSSSTSSLEESCTSSKFSKPLICKDDEYIRPCKVVLSRIDINKSLNDEHENNNVKSKQNRNTTSKQNRNTASKQNESYNENHENDELDVKKTSSKTNTNLRSTRTRTKPKKLESSDDDKYDYFSDIEIISNTLVSAISQKSRDS